MNAFSISQLAQFSGIKPHTIRIWEQRYNALKPSRTEGNTRYYDNSQLRRLLNIVSLMDSEYKVSELCSMADKKLFKLVEEFQGKTGKSESNEYFISQLIAAGTSYDEASFEKSFSHCLLRYGMRDTYKNIIHPMLVRIGLMWASNSIAPAHEHFISNLIRQKLFTAIDSLPPAKTASDCWLLFLPENEFHEIGLLFAQYLIRLSGRKAFYLGANVPLHSLVDGVKSVSPSNLLLFLVHHYLPGDAELYLKELSDSFKGKKIYLSGKHSVITQLTTPKNLYRLYSVEDLEDQLPVVNV